MFRVSIFIQGGLGNKLFQIAMIIGYSIKYHREPILLKRKIHNNHQTITDWSYFRRDIEMVDDLPYKQINEGEYHGCFLNIEPQNCDILFDGYFQTEKYFSHCRDIIYRQFSCPEDKVLIFQKKYPQLREGVFLHIRLGDNLSNPWAKKLYWFDLAKFRERALKHFPEDATFFIFSDENDKVKDDPFVQSLKKKIIIVENEIDSLWIMSLCRIGGICSNSTYSWWGGYLNSNKDKKIIFPDRMNNEINYYYKDLVPENFIVEKTD